MLKHLPGEISNDEIEEMIDTVDRNKDGKISYSEFRVMLGAVPLLIPDQGPLPGKQEQEKKEY